MLVGHAPTTLLTTAEVAELFRVHPRTIRRWVHGGLIQGFRVRGSNAYRFRTTDVLKALDADREPQAS